jgi:hypothetical protein
VKIILNDWETKRDDEQNNSLKMTKGKSYTLHELIDKNNLVKFIKNHYSINIKDIENGLLLNEAYEYLQYTANGVSGETGGSVVI